MRFNSHNVTGINKQKKDPVIYSVAYFVAKIVGYMQAKKYFLVFKIF